MKKLVLYTTVDGNTQAVAMKIAEKIGAASAARAKQSRATLDHYLGGKN